MNKVDGADKPERHLVPVDGLSEFKVAISNELFERLGQRLFETQSQERLYATVVEEIRSIIAAEEAPLTEEERHRLTLEIARDVMGYGPIEKFLDDESVSEVMVNGTGFIYIEQDGRITATHARFISEEHLRRIVDRIVSQVGRRIDE
jgi:pilus assembly protein CpaF